MTDWKGKITAQQLAGELLKYPTYYVILCGVRIWLEPSPWCDDFEIEVDHDHKVIRLSGEFT